tara:strand:+ start:135 stop:683 length:549 start_codon:yes stop_codon:yes gene_type:complete
MKKIIPFCLTLIILLGSAGMSAGADFQKGYAAYQNKDYATALREWRPLAEQGNADAANHIGQMYKNGRGVPRDHKTAVKWYRLAAEEGHAFGALNLAFAYFGARGVEENWVSGYVWALISLDSATKVVESKKNVSLLRKYQSIIDKHVPRIKEDIKKKLTSVQITDSEKLARECIRKKYKGC